MAARRFTNYFEISSRRSILSFAIAIGEFGATAFLVRPQRPTIPTTIFNLLGRPGASTYGQAMALCVVLAGITAISISLLDRTGTVIRDNA